MRDNLINQMNRMTLLKQNIALREKVTRLESKLRSEEAKVDGVIEWALKLCLTLNAFSSFMGRTDKQTLADNIHELKALQKERKDATSAQNG
jgi:hypothetical protein